MVVTVHLHTFLQRETPDGVQHELDVMLLSGSSVAEMIVDLGLEMPVEALVVVVNGRLTEPTSCLQAGDQVHLIPALTGR